MKDLGIYVHIPFCKQKCKYCDFVSANCDEIIQDKYINALISEIKNTKLEDYKAGDCEANAWYSSKSYNEVNPHYIVNTIYIGGGTPSYIDSKYIVKILNEIESNFEIDKNVEITIEINPGTINKEKLEDYKKVGINRLSLGLQSTHNKLLNLIGRIHTYEEFLDTYKLAEKVGFENINIDLMLALPTQTENELLDSVNKIISLNPNHISIYSLILEEETPLKQMIDKKELELIDEEIERKMYWNTKKLLEKNGYIHYEISNFSKQDCFSKHNLNCWNQEEYIGFGLAAHSYIKNKRFSNIDDIEKYIKSIEENKYEDNIEILEEQTREEKLKEFMMLGFRKIDGISISEFERKFKINPLFYFRFEISKLVNQELMEVDLDNIKLTKKGLDFANLVFEEFV